MPLFRAFAVFLVFVVCSIATPGRADPLPAWRMTDATGDVQLLRGGVQLASVSSGMILQQGDVVVTGKKGRAVVARGAEYIMVSPGSRISLPETQPDGWTWIKQEVGNVLFKVQKKSTPHFEVQTPYLAAAVKGTTFSVSVNSKGATVQVTEGAVQVSTVDGLSSQILRPGGLALVSAVAPTQLQMTVPENTPVQTPTESAPNTEPSTSNATAPEDKPAMVITETIAPEPVTVKAATAGLAREEVVAPVQSSVAVIAPPTYRSPVVAASVATPATNSPEANPVAVSTTPSTVTDSTPVAAGPVTVDVMPTTVSTPAASTNTPSTDKTLNIPPAVTASPTPIDTTIPEPLPSTTPLTALEPLPISGPPTVSVEAPQSAVTTNVKTIIQDNGFDNRGKNSGPGNSNVPSSESGITKPEDNRGRSTVNSGDN